MKGETGQPLMFPRVGWMWQNQSGKCFETGEHTIAIGKIEYYIALNSLSNSILHRPLLHAKQLLVKVG
jgi:hypothetical protein